MGNKLNANNSQTTREQWEHKTGFAFSCIGYAVGISNIVRFPSLCYRNGGGAFLIPYLIVLFIVGISLFFFEAILGQFSGYGLTKIYAICPILRGTGFGQIISNVFCVCYYSVIVAYPIRYLGAVFYKKLPWADCSNPWNSPECQDPTQLKNLVNRTGLVTPAFEFFHNEVLQISSSINEYGTVVWPLLLSLLVCWILIFLCIMKGVKSVGKVVYFTATFPYVILFCLLIRGVTLSGAGNGILFYIKPDWSRLGDSSVWLDACLQTFFSLGPGWGGIINMAGFNNFNQHIMVDSTVVPVVNALTSIFAGFVVFSVLGHLSEVSGIPIDQLTDGGPELAYITYPQAIAQMPIPNLWAFLFFIMLILLGLDSVFVQLETVISSVIDEIPYLQKPGLKIYITLVTCVVLFLISIILIGNGGIYIVTLLELYALSIPILIYSLILNIAAVYIYPINNFMTDYIFMFGNHRGIIIWKALWLVITPIFLIVILIATLIIFNTPSLYSTTAEDVPLWSVVVAWLLTAIPLSAILFYAIYYMIVHKTWTWEKYKLAFRPTNWYPRDSDIRAEYFQYKADIKAGAPYPTLSRRNRI